MSGRLSLAELVRAAAEPPPEPATEAGRARERWLRAVRTCRLRQREADEARQDLAEARQRSAGAEHRAARAYQEQRQRISEYFAEVHRDQEITRQAENTRQGDRT